MSYRIEYQWALFRISPQETGLPEERFIVAIEGGDSNLREPRTGRRARSWEVGMIGTSVQVLQRAVQVAAECEGGSLKLHDRDCTPEAYIRRIRKLLDSPPLTPQGAWEPRLRVPEGHPAAQQAASLALGTEVCTRYDRREVHVKFRPRELALFFDFVDRYRDLKPWAVAEVFGLPES
jgi:hypothetical protein